MLVGNGEESSIELSQSVVIDYEQQEVTVDNFSLIQEELPVPQKRVTA